MIDESFDHLKPKTGLSDRDKFQSRSRVHRIGGAPVELVVHFYTLVDFINGRPVKILPKSN